MPCAVKCLSYIACVACRCGEMFILYCLCGLPVRWNVYLILPVGLACAAKCLSNIACEVCLCGEMFIQYCLCGLPAW